MTTENEAANPTQSGNPKDPEDRPGGRAIFTLLPEVILRKGEQRFREREEALFDVIEKGHYPAFSRLFVDLPMPFGPGKTAIFKVSVDCFAVGHEDDWLRVAMSGYYADKVARLFGCSLPTNKIVFEAHRRAQHRLFCHPFKFYAPFTPTYQCSNLACRLHEEVLQGNIPCQKGQAESPEAIGKIGMNLGQQKHTCSLPPGRHPGTLVGGHKKEVVLCAGDLSTKLAFAGFFGASDDKPLQSGVGVSVHGAGYFDYAHGFRLVQSEVKVGDDVFRYDDLVKDPKHRAHLFEGGGGPCSMAHYADPPAPPKSFNAV